MDEVRPIPELKQILGALLFGAKSPLKAAEIRQVLARVAKQKDDASADFAKLKEEEIRTALLELQLEINRQNLGIRLVEVAHGFRFENDKSCSPWLRQLLEPGKTDRLSQPALENVGHRCLPTTLYSS